MRLLRQFQTFFFFFCEKILYAPKSTKATKAPNTQKTQKHKKHKNAIKQKQNNGNKGTKIKNALKKHLSGKK